MTSNHDSTRCVICIRAKQTRKPFRSSKSKVTRKLERIHSDVCGPFPTSKGGSVYILTFLDEFTHWCWVVTIADRTSSTICREYRNIVKQIETETDLKIKYLRTDGGKEYEGDLTPVLKELGVKHETTSPYSPESNGKAERLNRTLEEHARAMLYQANMPKSFWAEAITTAAYLLNRLPSDAVHGIPYELWYNKSLTPVDLKALKPFGCMVHAHVSKKRQKKIGKIDTRSHFGCFIGYTDSNTMHKIWNFERKRFEKPHSLIFQETLFPSPKHFDETPADSYNPLSSTPSATPSATPESSPEPQNRSLPQLYDEIVVQPPPALQVFKSYGEFQPDNDPPSFSDAMRRPDANLWWEAFCDEIKAIIARNTWILVKLPPGNRALPLRWVCRIKR
ncbi:MAG: transposase family protein, partial [Bacteroidetes bacterium]